MGARGDRIDSSDRHLATLETDPSHGPVTRPNIVAVGTIVWLASELMFFAGLFAMYFTVRSISPALWQQQTVHLHIPSRQPTR